LKSFGDEAVKVTINPLKTEKSVKDFITPGPGQYNTELTMGNKFAISSLRNTVTSVWTKEKRFIPPYSNKKVLFYLNNF